MMIGYFMFNNLVSDVSIGEWIATFYLDFCFLGFGGCHGWAGGLAHAYKSDIKIKNMNSLFMALLMVVEFI
jgi:hypothetical protein